ncbi:hypothetical protein EK21DRAFT_111268 [Setomelanomma holmii]|uniref:Uncharacterized protein n=1 Tax=Setomelanomma holmii TaxID=210430 RepID=A0A9P4HDE9_9PLEO|nr:hypothetical protein EK21DRAFT_111268 [Setomelanomma holmii]
MSRCACIQDPVTISNCRSPLMQLPQEIRDLLCHHTFQAERGLVVRIRNSNSCIHVREHGQDLEAKEAQCPDPYMLVCHQLWHETRKAVYKANSEIALLCESYRNPSYYTFSRMVGYIGHIAVAQLRRVEVYGRQCIDLKRTKLTWKEVCNYFTRFEPFCRSHLRTTVIIRFQRVADVTGTTWITKSFSLKELIRGPETMNDITREAAWRKELVTLELGPLITSMRQLPPNLKFSLLEKYPETAIKAEAAWGATSAKWVEEILPHARTLWEDGI